MTDWTRRTAAQMADALAAGEVTSVSLTQAHLDRIAAVDGDVHAFLYVNTERALETAAAVDADRAAGISLQRLAGVPIGIKDVLVTEGLPTTAGSRILEGWIPPYDATLVTGLDLPWVADGLQRDGPHVREPVDALVRDALAKAAVPYRVVYGSGEERLANALVALGEMTHDVPQRLRNWVCEKCSDPDCEHRLFTRKLG